LLDRENGTLFRDGVLVPVGQKGVLLLGALAADPGQVRTKAELMDAAWPGVTVEESNLSVQIGSLRKLLGPAPTGGEWIATVPRVGYRFVGQPGTTADSAERRPLADLPALAVLPFQNMSGDPEQEYFADGMVDDILMALSRVRWLFVIARQSSFIYKVRAADVQQIGRELGVRYVVEGSVRKSGTRVRIVAQLIETETGAHIWADRYEGDLRDIFALQDAITERIVSAVEVNVQDAEIRRARVKPTDSLTAYDLYLRALPAWFGQTQAEYRRTQVVLGKAIDVDPEYAEALGTLPDSVASGT
jgi:TolB-like protein